MSLVLLEIIGDGLIIGGEITIAYMVIAVHGRLREEHKIDDRVNIVINREHLLGILSIFMLVTGFMLRIFARHILAA